MTFTGEYWSKGLISIGIVGWGEGGDELDFIRDIPECSIDTCTFFNDKEHRISYNFVTVLCSGIIDSIMRLKYCYSKCINF